MPTVRVAIYTRVSTEDQAKQGFSLEAQRERLEAYCLARDWSVAAKYIDDGHSGRNVRRPAYQRMMAERDQVYVTFDGQDGYELEASDEVRICCAPRRLKLLHPSVRSYFVVLREKLKWNER